MEQIAEVVIPHERLSDRSSEQVGKFLVQQIEEEIVEVVLTFPQKRIKQFIAEQTVDDRLWRSRAARQRSWKLTKFSNKNFVRSGRDRGSDANRCSGAQDPEGIMDISQER